MRSGHQAKPLRAIWEHVSDPEYQVELRKAFELILADSVLDLPAMPFDENSASRQNEKKAAESNAADQRNPTSI
jgi:hypothetical protein